MKATMRGGRLAPALTLALAILLAAAAAPPPRAAALAPNPDPDLIAVWEPCEPGVGVTVVVDRFARLGDGRIDVRCAPGPQPDGWRALLAAGFAVEGVGGGVGFVCRLDGLPTATEESCLQTPGADRYWSYWHGKPGGRWAYSGVGAANPLSGAPVDSVQGWSFGGAPRIGPLNGAGPAAFELPPPQASSTAAAAHAREWLMGVLEATAAGAAAGEVSPDNDDMARLLAGADALAGSDTAPAPLPELSGFLAAACEWEGTLRGGCALRSFADPDAPANRRFPERLAAGVLGVAGLGADPGAFAGMDLRGALAGLIDDATGRVQRQSRLQDAVEFTAPTLLALARTGPLGEPELRTLDLILAKQDPSTGAFAVLTTAHARAIEALVAARDAFASHGAGNASLDETRLVALEAALERAGDYLEGIQDESGGVRRRANPAANHDPNLESTAAGAVGLALTGRTAAAREAARWVSRYQVTREYAGAAGPGGASGTTPAEAAIGAFLPSAAALAEALAAGVPSSSHGVQAAAQLPTVQALAALSAAGPYGPLFGSLQPPSLRFEARPLGSTPPVHEVTLANRDRRPLRLERVELAGEGAADFAVDSGGCLAAALAPGDECVLAVRFAPGAVGVREAVARLLLAGGEELALALGGSGLPAAGKEPDAAPPPAPEEPGVAPPPGAPSPSLARVAAAATARLGPGGLARLATLACPPPSSCAVRTPLWVPVRIGGRRHGARVVVPRRLAAGASAPLRARLTPRGAAGLAGRRATVRVRVRVGSVAGVVDRLVTASLSAPGPPAASPAR